MRHRPVPEQVDFDFELRVPIPDSERDEEELFRSLQDEGVLDLMAFSKNVVATT